LAATRQGAFESIISFKQHYNYALKAYNNQKNPVIKPEDIMMVFEKVDAEVRINGVGGVQLSTDETGYLPDFFRVYSSPHTKVNVLSFANVGYVQYHAQTTGKFHSTST
jgi:hypothetical protein